MRDDAAAPLPPRACPRTSATWRPAGLYLLSPRTAHRLVGYIEEMAVVTYTNIVEMMATPGTKLHAAWSTRKAPPIAIQYWRLEPDASFLDVIKQVRIAHYRHP